MIYIFKDLKGQSLSIDTKSISFVEELKIAIHNIHHHIEPYEIQVCVDGTFLQKLDKLPSNKIIHIWQKYNQTEKYKVSDVFDALSQIHGVFYNHNSFFYASEYESSEDSFYSIDSE